VLRNNIDFETSLSGEVSFIARQIQKKSTSYELMDFLFISPQTGYYTGRNRNLYLQGGIHGSLVR